jgi:glycosyltransferase involved in cell wall biosynthesis
VHNGVNSQEYFLGNAGKHIVQRRGLVPGEYLLTVGRLEPRKNHKNLFKAYSLLGKDVPPLVVIGQKDFKYKEIFQLVEDLKISSGSISWTMFQKRLAVVL